MWAVGLIGVFTDIGVGFDRWCWLNCGVDLAI